MSKRPIEAAPTSPVSHRIQKPAHIFLLLVLLLVALSTWQDRYRSTRWREPLYVAIYPIAADAQPGDLALCCES